MAVPNVPSDPPLWSIVLPSEQEQYGENEQRRRWSKEAERQAELDAEARRRGEQTSQGW